MGQVRGPIRVGPMGSKQLDQTAGPGNPVQFGHYRHWLLYMLYNMAAYHLVELIIVKRIRQIIQVVYDVGISARIDVHADSPGGFVDPTTNVQHPSTRNSRPGSHMRRASHSDAHSGLEGLFGL